MLKKIFLASILACMHIWLASAFEASYYSDEFEGDTSANGTTFSQSNHTAAICYEELSQLAYVSTAHTGMVVTLTDRPNCSRHTDRIDLSSSVFSRFAPLSQWLISDISARPLGIKTWKFIKRNISQEEFSSLWIRLYTPIANVYTRSEIIHLKWVVLGWEKYMMTYLESKKTGKKISRPYPVTNGIFNIALTIPDDVGEYYLVIAAGTSFRTESPLPIMVVDPIEMPIAPLPVWLNRFSLRQTSIVDTPFIALWDGLYGELSLIQGKKTYNTSGQVLGFSGTHLERGTANYIFTGYTLATASSLDRAPTPTYYSSWSILLDKEFDSAWSEKVRVTKQSRSMTFRFNLWTTKKIIDTYYVTLPNGDVRKYEFPSKYRDGSGYLKTGIQIQATFPTPDVGTYKLETVEHDGFAYFNIPLTRGDVWNIFPKLTQSEIQTITTAQNTVRDTTFVTINSLRTSLGRNALTRDSILDTLAQKKAENMAKWQYVWHITPDGLSIREFSESLGMKISSSIGENVAWWNVSGAALQDGLEESWSHRANMIEPGWTKVWVGYVVSGNKTYMVHIFGN